MTSKLPNQPVFFVILRQFVIANLGNSSHVLQRPLVMREAVRADRDFGQPIGDRWRSNVLRGARAPEYNFPTRV
jgi:hypothetical protein